MKDNTVHINTAFNDVIDQLHNLRKLCLTIDGQRMAAAKTGDIDPTMIENVILAGTKNKDALKICFRLFTTVDNNIDSISSCIIESQECHNGDDCEEEEEEESCHCQCEDKK